MRFSSGACRHLIPVLAALAVTLGGLASPAVAQGATRGAGPPAFDYDVDWLKAPPQWLVGDISAVAVDASDNVWVLHRPRTLPADQRSRAAPPVMEFDRNGRFLRAWGGAGAGYDWPATEHSLFVDSRNRVWLSGNSRAAGASDDAILVFTAEGKFIRQIGRENASKGDLDTSNVNAVADLYVDLAHHDLYAADGYGNHRVIVFESETGAFKRMWGAFGGPPPSTPPAASAKPQGAGEGPATFESVHGVELARDGLLYVSDRHGQRVQVFDRSGRYKAQVFVDRDGPSPETASGLALSPDRDQRWLYVADFGNNRIVAFDRRTLTPAATFGGPGVGPAQFRGPHLMAMDSRGVLYVAEVQGRRVQRLTPK
jgi:DNA-binding beta-propeller fold protein YncE